MKVRYRIVEEVTQNGEWETVGVIALWLSDTPHLQLRAILAHTVSRSIWKTIQQRVAERQLTLETYHKALEDYNGYYRIQPEIHDIKAQTPNEIRRYFREKYIFLDHQAVAPQVVKTPLLAVMA